MDDPPREASALFAQSPEPRNTRERILFCAIDLFFTHGMSAVGLDMILAESGLTKTTFYNHFSSKDELVEAAISMRNDWEVASFKEALHRKAGYEPKALLMACFDVLDEWFSNEAFRGCLFLMAINDYPHPSDPINRAGAKHYLITRETVTEIAKAAGVRDPAGFAMTWSTMLLGATGMQLVDPGGGSARSVRAAAEVYLESCLTTPA